MTAKNREYLAGLGAQIREAGRAYMVETGRAAFSSAVEDTVQDSGQAAANWQMIPYDTEATYGAFKIMRGTKTRDPVPPVGYRGDKGKNRQEVITAQYTLSLGIAEQAKAMPVLAGISIYNPINASAGDDDGGPTARSAQRYEQNAMYTVDLKINSQYAIEAGEKFVKAHYPGVF